MALEYVTFYSQVMYLCCIVFVGILVTQCITHLGESQVFLRSITMGTAVPIPSLTINSLFLYHIGVFYE